MVGVARRSWPREKRRVLDRRRVMRDLARGGFAGLLVVVVVVDVGEGARRSLRAPVRMRAKVEERAMTETWVAGEFDGGMGVEGGYRVGIMVPTLLMKASPGPVVRKKPAAMSHMAGSVRKRRVSVLSSMVFLRAMSES